MTTFEIEVARCTVASRYLGSVLLLMPTVWVSSTLAAPPDDPLPAPTYSFSRASPTVEAGFVTADACLVLSQPVPDIGVEGALLGFGLPGDDLDALASDNIALDGEELFALLFSVDAATLGVVGPDSDLVEEGVPFNSRHQAVRGQQAGDQFMSTTLYELDDGEDTGLPNNVLVRNNYDEGGVDFAALPPTSARHRGFPQAQDEVDATARFSTEMVYYSATGDSPSLSTLPFLDEPSGAHILAAIPSQNQVFLFASFSDLGLQQEDDIDALIVFDTNSDGVFQGSDQVLFSLAPGSPSLATIPGASEIAPAADVYLVAAGESPVLFASAASLGLGRPADNVDALELLVCDDYEDCAEDHGIRGPGGESDDDEPEDDDLEGGGDTTQLRGEED
ncbi:MAG: hypothetical protein IID37_13590 [Planctomycetes bacterium]|nr:hypothetical protein [Planctomycetota bacterium]